MAQELQSLHGKVDESNKILKELIERCDNTDQYIKIDNLIIDGFKDVPVHLKGHLFSGWVANQLNFLIPELDFEILPRDISISHPLYNKETIPEL